MFGIKLTITLGIITLIYYFVLGLLMSNMPTETKIRMREFDEYPNGFIIGAFVFMLLCIADFIGIIYSLVYIIWLR